MIFSMKTKFKVISNSYFRTRCGEFFWSQKCHKVFKIFGIKFAIFASIKYKALHKAGYPYMNEKSYLFLKVYLS